jgi:hypothetical protein
VKWAPVLRHRRTFNVIASDSSFDNLTLPISPGTLPFFIPSSSKEGLFPMRINSILLVASLMLSTNAAAQNAGMQPVNDAISAAERICLSGSKFHFEVKGDGSLSVTKFDPAGNLTFSVDRTTARGAQFIHSEQMKMLMDRDIRECLERQWPLVKNAYDQASIPGLGRAQILKQYRNQNNGCELGTHLRCVPGFPCLCEGDE